MKNTKLRKLCVSAVLIALAVALSFVKIWHMPWGGSVTLLSMLPIALISVLYGLKQGLFSSLLYSCIQLFFGITTDGLLGWGLTGGMLVACMLLDYIVPYTAIGLSGLFREKGLLGVVGGTVMSLVIRLASHTLSGVFVFVSAGKLWDGFSTENSWLYSIVYNGCYMLPEIILTAIGAFFVYKALGKIINKI